MLLNGEKLNGLEEFLAEAMPATLASLRELLDSAQGTGVSLGITISATGPRKDRTLEETWNFVRDDQAEEYRLVKHSKSTHEEDRAKTHEEVPAKKAPTLTNEKLAERLMTELLTDGGDPESIDGGGADEAALDTAAPAKNRLAAPGKNGTQEKAAAAKAKPKQAGDEDAPPPVPVKYWITLAVAVALFLGAWSWQYFTRPVTPEQLTAMALSAGKPEDRINAVMELSMDNEMKVLPHLRRVLAKSDDPEVQVRAMTKLQAFNDWESVPLYFVAMENASPAVREMGYAGVLKHFGGAFPENLTFKADDPSEQRAKVVRRLQEIIEETKKRKGP